MKKRLEQLKKMLAEDPNDGFIRFAIAMEYKNLDMLDKAIKEFNDLKKLDPEYVGLYYHLAACYSEVEDFDNAIIIYNEGIIIAENQKDQHAKAELMNAKVNLEMEL